MIRTSLLAAHVFATARALAFLAPLAVGGAVGCDRPRDDDDGGTHVLAPIGDAGVRAVDAGARLSLTADAGAARAPAAPDAGVSAALVAEDAGTPAPWTLSGLFVDAGVPPALACLPDTLPSPDIQGLFAALALSPYRGRAEPGVVCGDTTCATDTPCCALCGLNQCADVDDAGAAHCPLLTNTYACDGAEDCPGDPLHDTCCLSLRGTDCRARADCTLTLPSLDGIPGIPSRESSSSQLQQPSGGLGAIPPPDGGVDDTYKDLPVDEATAAAGALADGGIVDTLGELLDERAPVCRSTLLDCDLFHGELCCTSERMVSLDLGVCLPGPLCLGGLLTGL